MGLLCRQGHITVSLETAVVGTWCRTLGIQIGHRDDGRRVGYDAALIRELRRRPKGQQGSASDQYLQPPHYCSFV